MIDSKDCNMPYCYIDEERGHFFAGMLVMVEVRYVFCMECMMYLEHVAHFSPYLANMVRACRGPIITNDKDFLALQRCFLASWMTDVLTPIKQLPVKQASTIACDWHTFAVSMNEKINKPPATRKFMECVLRNLTLGAKKVVQKVENQFCEWLVGLKF